MNKIKWLVLVFLSGISFNSISQVNDAGLWTSLSVNKKINSSLSANLSQEFRFNENISELGTVFTEAGLSYKIKYIKRLTGSFSYRFTQNRRIDDTFSLRHRLTIEMGYRLKWQKLTATIRERFQSQVRDVRSSPEGFSPVSYLRNRLALKYDLQKKYSPWISGELFYQVNNPDGNSIDNVRYALGLDYKINKKNSLTLSYLINKEVNVKNPLTSYVSGIDYSFNF